jgi:hypothetical protein
MLLSCCIMRSVYCLAAGAVVTACLLGADIDVSTAG